MIETLLHHYETGKDDSLAGGKGFIGKLMIALQVYIENGFLFTVKYAFSRLRGHFFRR